MRQQAMTSAPSPIYRPLLETRVREQAIKQIKDFFEVNLASALGLNRVSAPLFVHGGLGINDDLNGVEKPVRFAVKDLGGAELELVQSLAKWKRLALHEYGYQPGQGIYTDMNAVRPDETLDHLHSIYVDQWDWEAIIRPEERNLETLKRYVRAIYETIRRTEYYVASLYPQIVPVLPIDITFATSEELYQRWPDKTPKERERAICQEHKAVFVIGIGDELPDGKPHDGRAPDYDDWSAERPDGGKGLNGDLLLWNDVLEDAFELSSMGIRVDPAALRRQLAMRGAEKRASLHFHSLLLNGVLPQTIGGGIGQSRLCMFLLRAVHVGEVAVSVWPEAMVTALRAKGVELL
jgi:aspartate--ammonia ligase